MRILLISRRIPYPPNSGYPLRVYNLLYRIAREHEIWLVTFIPVDCDTKAIVQLRNFCRIVETSVFQDQGALSDPVRAMQYFFRGTPPDLRILDSLDFSEKISNLIAQVDFDIIQIEDSQMGIFLDIVPKQLHPRTILTFHDVNFKKYDQLFHLEPKKSSKSSCVAA